MILANRSGVMLLEDLDDPLLDAAGWEGLLAVSESRTVFQTRDWARAWWSTYGRGRLLPIVVERRGDPVLLAPLFADGGMAFLVGSGGSDELDLIGDTACPGALEEALAAARDGSPDFVGIRLYHVPDDSMTGARLASAARNLDLDIFDEGDLAVPAIAGPDMPALLTAAADRTSLRRHERALARLGRLEVEHLRDGRAIAPLLHAFFEQHVARWAATDSPSLFLDARNRAFYRALVATDAACLRFTRVLLDGRAVAMHLGFHHEGTFLWYKPSFDIALARHSPGEVLLRHLFLFARDEGAERFDFGIGDEAFKGRFATETRRVRTWGLYPRAERG